LLFKKKKKSVILQQWN